MKTRLVKEDLKTEKNYYWRLPKKVIGNELYPVQRNLKSLYDTVSNDNDLNMEQLEGIIRRLNKIKDAAKRFEAGEKPTRDFE